MKRLEVTYVTLPFPLEFKIEVSLQAHIVKSMQLTIAAFWWEE